MNRAAALRAEAARRLGALGWPEAERDLPGVLRWRALTWVTVPRPPSPAAAQACRAVLRVLARASSLSADDAEAALMKAAASLWLGRKAGFEEQVERALALGPGRDLPWLWKSFSLLARNDASGAMAAADRGLSLGAGAWGSCLRAEARLRLGRKAEALSDLDRCLALDPGRPWALALKSEALRDLKRFDEALAVLHRLVRLHPGPWSFALRARTAFNFRDKALGLADLDRALRADPGFLEGYAYRGEAYRRLGRHREALRDFNRVLSSRRAGLERIRSWRGALLLQMGRPREAVRDLTPDILVEPEGNVSWALCQRAHAYLRLGEFERAVRDMNRALRVNPKNGWIHGIPERAGNTLGLHAEVVERFSEAVRRRPRWAWGWAWRGETHARAGRFAEALADLERAVGLSPREALFRAWRGLARQGLGDLAGAEADFEEALRLDPGYAPAHGWLAHLAMRRGGFSEALPRLDRLLALDPLCAWAYAWRGECRLKGGDEGAAGEDLEKAVNLDPGYADAWAWLGEARRRRGDLPGALAACERALGLTGDRALALLVRGMVRGEQGRPEERLKDFGEARRLRPGLFEGLPARP